VKRGGIMSDTPLTRRDVIRKSVYITPVIVTLPVLPSFASAGSDSPKFKDDKGKDKDKNDKR
jgi:hypothetical protein